MKKILLSLLLLPLFIACSDSDSDDNNSDMSKSYYWERNLVMKVTMYEPDGSVKVTDNGTLKDTTELMTGYEMRDYINSLKSFQEDSRTVTIKVYDNKPNYKYFYINQQLTEQGKLSIMYDTWEKITPIIE